VGGFPLPGGVEFEAHVAPLCLPTRPTFRLANLDFDSASEVVFWHFWGLELSSFAFKNQFVFCSKNL